MSRTLTALFDTRADAEAGRQRLIDAAVDADHIKIHDKSSIGDSDDSDDDRGMWASIKNSPPDDSDRHVYEEGVRRGGFLLTCDIDSDDVGEALRALEDTGINSVDIDERASQWRAEGWNPPAGGDGTDRPIGQRSGARVRSYGGQKGVY